MAQFIAAALSRFIFLLIILVFSLFSLPAVAAQTRTASLALPEFPTVEPAEPSANSVPANLVGYDARSMTLLVNGQTVQLEFAGASGAWPEAEAGANLHGEQVTYRALWSGIDLVVLNAAGGGVTVLYKLAPFADPGQIQVITSAAFQIQPDGSLRAETRGGAASVSAPRAWQEIAGQRVEVAAGHVVTASQGGALAAFHLGAYEPAYPLVIEVVFGG